MSSIASVANVQSQSTTSGFQQVPPQANVSQQQQQQQQQVSGNASFENIPQSSNHQGTMAQHGGQQQRKQQLACLYTKQKTQKRKKWNDGRLVLHSTGASLYDAHPPPGSGDPKLDECCLTRQQCNALLRQAETRLETDKFLVQVEGPWAVSTAPMTVAKPNALVSQGMKKVITRKFKKPGTFVPRNPMQEQQNQAPAMRKRQRQPLQPGELQRKYYGGTAPQQARPPPGAPPAWNQGPQQGPPTGRGPAHFQGQQQPQQFQQQQFQPQQQQQQQPPRNQTTIGYNNPSPQPPFLQQRQPPLHPGQPNLVPNGYGNERRPQQYNTPPTAAPPHQATFQQPQPVQPSRAPATTNTNGNNTTSFVRNKFNPNQFYGEDEEECSQEEVEDDDDVLGGFTIQQVGRNPTPNQNSMDAPGSSAGRASSMVNSQPDQSSRNKQSDNTGASVPPQGQTNVTAECRNNASEGSGNSSALSKNELLKLFGASPSVPATEQTEATNRTTPDTQPTQQQPSKFELVLPPDAASDEDSSSDESDN